MARPYPAHAHAACRAFPGGITCGREALALAEQVQQPWSFVIARLALGHLHGPRRDFGGAVRGMEARALHLLAGTVARCDPKDTEIGEARSRESLALAEELGMRPLVAHCHLTLGKLYRRTDYRDQAQERLTRATVMYRE